jgi:hypothetical protein
VYAGLDHTAPAVLATPMLLLGVAAAWPAWSWPAAG